jgi:glutathione peroxidase
VTTDAAIDVYGFEALSIDGRPVSLERFRGDVLLIVNVASRCGFTPQYQGLEALYRRHRAAGLTVLGFPCNQFGRQEPGSHAEIRRFCSETYGVTFPLFARIDVNGPAAHPLFAYLKGQQKGLLGSSAIKWNFTKFLVDRGGRVVRRFAPREAPGAIEPAIVRLLASARREPGV